MYGLQPCVLHVRPPQGSSTISKEYCLIDSIQSNYVFCCVLDTWSGVHSEKLRRVCVMGCRMIK